MRYFGEPHDAPVYEETERASTPVGVPCSSCKVPIEDGDDGFLIPDLFTLGVDATIDESPWHRRCLLSEILGPAARLLDRPATSR